MSSPGHEWTKHEREGWSVCSRCGMVRNYDRETTTCSGSLPKIRQRSEIEDCGQDGVCKLSPGSICSLSNARPPTAAPHQSPACAGRLRDGNETQDTDQSSDPTTWRHGV